MAIGEFRVENFRCVAAASLRFDPEYNEVHGPNASGKTSLLEALAFLGRGRSFRGAAVTDLVRRETDEFVVFGRVERNGREHGLGVRNSRNGLEIRVDRESATAADLAALLPLQVIDPDVHELVAGGPEVRRRFLDWIAFHVEHDFLETWRRFRRALKQRNAALKSGQGIQAWTEEFVSLGERLDAQRRSVIDRATAELTRQVEGLLGESVAFEYRRGWPEGKSLEDALASGLAREREMGSSQSGPHRAELTVVTANRRARRIVSRGQQKLLACGMILAATKLVQDSSGERMLVLLDDPAAELDGNSLARLMEQVFELGSQVVATSLVAGAVRFPRQPAVFHVEHGQVTAG